MARLSAAEEENAVKTAAEIDLDHVVDIAGVKVRHSPLRRIKPEEQQFVRATVRAHAALNAVSELSRHECKVVGNICTFLSCARRLLTRQWGIFTALRRTN